MAKSFRCTIVTPAAAVFDEEIGYASIPAWDGQLGVMNGQSPLLIKLGIGSLRLDGADGKSVRYLVEGGFAQVNDNLLTILTERAHRPEDLSSADADRELAAANARAVAPGVARTKAEAEQERARAMRAMAKSIGR